MDVTLALPGAQANLWLQGIEVTQAVQTWVPENGTVRRATGPPPTYFYPSPSGGTSMPLVADRAPAVRVYAGVEGTQGGVPLEGATATLRCATVPDFFLPCPGPYSLRDDRNVPVDPSWSLGDKRRDAARSWNFALPDEWVHAGPIYLEAEVQASSETPECNGCFDAANRMRLQMVQFTATVDFQSQVMKLLAIGTNVGGTFQIPTLTEIRPFLDYIRRTYPVNESTVQSGPEGIYYTVETSKTCDSMLGKLAGPVWDPGSRLGVQGVAKVTGYDCGGNSWLTGGKQGFSIAGSSRSTTAHELGHNLGFLHAGPPPGHGGECASAAFCDNWPWPHGTTGDADFGFDVLDPALGKVYPPGSLFTGTRDTTETHDFMSYGPNPWISSRTWVRIFNILTGSSLPVPSHLASLPRALPAQQVYFLVRGELDPGTGWGLLPVFEVDAPVGTSDGPGAGAYSLSLRAGDGSPLATRAFDLGLAIDGSNPGLQPSFAEMIPWVAGVETIELWEGGSLLASVSRSPAAPTVQIFSPTASGFAGEPNSPYISWAGQDADLDPLVYLVEYTPLLDGTGQGDWRTLTLDAEVTQLDVLSPELLPGGTAARIRVSASDGLNVTRALSPPFLVPDKPPQVQIITPVEFALALEGFPLVLRASAWDLEDGWITDPNQFAWISLLDGVIGTGPRVDTTTLSPGLHLLGPMVADSAGGLGSDATLVAVFAVPNRQPQARAGPDHQIGVGGIAPLDGTDSSDPDGDPLTYHWSLVSQPPGGNAAIADPNAGSTTFTDPGVEGDYVVGLVVDDGQTASLEDQAVVHVGPPPNDDAWNATPISDGFTAGTLFGATNDGSASQGTPNQPDVWYLYTPLRDGLLRVDTCGTHDALGIDTGPDTVLSLHPGPIDPELAVNDDWPFGSDPNACLWLDAGVPRDSAIALASGGEPVWIRVSRFDATTDGDFFLSVRLTSPGDTDLDGHDDPVDDCPYTWDPGQEDADGDGIGDACTCGDVSNDGLVDVLDWTLHERYLQGKGPGLADPQKCSVSSGPDQCNGGNRDALRQALAGIPPGVLQVCSAAFP